VEGDTIEDNNRAVGTVVVRGGSVLIADRDRSHAQSLAGALRSQNIEVSVVDPAAFPKTSRDSKIRRRVLSNVRR